MITRNTETSKKSDVLVVGAGPVGLMLALLLRDRDVSVDLIEKRTHTAQLSKGLTNNPSALDVFRQIPDLLQNHLNKGFRVDRVNLLRGNKPLSNFSMHSLGLENNYFNILPQWKTEELIERSLTFRGTSVRRGQRLVAIQQSSDSVVATIEGETGISEHREYQYVVGADGFHSSVRELLGIESPITRHGHVLRNGGC